MLYMKYVVKPIFCHTISVIIIDFWIYRKDNFANAEKKTEG